jgi:GNAT superfamily N-acetyltransferase
MPVPDHVHRFWRALDHRVARHIEPAWWGVVVTDDRFPAIWDINYARIDAAAELRIDDVADPLLPRLASVGSDVFHVVSFHPEETTGLLSDLSTLGHALSWDVVMDQMEPPSIDVDDSRVEELAFDPELRERVRASFELFGVLPGSMDQLIGLEDAVVSASGKRWFGIREGGELVSLAALVQLEGVGYVDNVATFPRARGRGAASAVTSRVTAEARDGGAEHICLFVDADDPAALRMYGRLGFRETGRLASTRGPAATVDRPRAAPAPG